MEDVLFSLEDIMCIQRIIEAHEGEPWTVHHGIRELWFRNSDSTAEFRLLFLFDIAMTVSRVSFVKRRVGTMTAVMNYCKQFAKKHGVNKLVIQSVQTPEMARWCLKNGYLPNPSASIEIDGLVIGDYEIACA
jgi:hypothetical protein